MARRAILLLFLTAASILDLPFAVHPLPLSHALPAEDVQSITDAQYFQTAKKLIQEAKKSIQVMMFEMSFYGQHASTPSNLLIKELIGAKKRGVRVEVILDVREEGDRTTKRNRHTGKVLSDGGVEVLFDPLSRTTHAKMMIIDGELTLVGSTNWTYYALTNNHEVSVLIRSKDVAREMMEYFSRVKATGTPANPKSQSPIPRQIPIPNSK